VSIRRGRLTFEDHFTTIPNQWVRDSRISLRARGLLAQLMSHRVGWQVTVAQMVKDNPEGRDAIQTALAELREHGYLVTQARRGEAGKFDGQHYDIVDPWEAAETRAPGNPVDGGPSTGESSPKEDHYQEDQSQEDHGRTSAPDGAGGMLDIPVEQGPTLEQQFAEIWQLWPRSQSKADAFKAFRAALKIVDFDVLAGSVQAWTFAAVQVWPTDKIPYLASWLRGQRWTEDPPVVPTAAPGGRLRGGELLSDLTELGAMMDAAGASAAPKGISR
jgi:hypothetical protein